MVQQGTKLHLHGTRRNPRRSQARYTDAMARFRAATGKYAWSPFELADLCGSPSASFKLPILLPLLVSAAKGAPRDLQGAQEVCSTQDGVWYLKLVIRLTTVHLFPRKWLGTPLHQAMLPTRISCCLTSSIGQKKSLPQPSVQIVCLGQTFQ